MVSVCTGAFLLHAAGPARGRRVATHWGYEDALEARGNVTVVRDARYVVDGNLLTSPGSLRGDRQRAVAGRPAARPRARAGRAARDPVRPQPRLPRRRAPLTGAAGSWGA
ncbi:DJ-1/PfpI family protein [Nonomuraea dietziae]|uniref:DJ-1/PfpI family protein n=1 Tax=Nonomuraea dietziae TaxID=65515 RepID=UPI0031D7905B